MVSPWCLSEVPPALPESESESPGVAAQANPTAAQNSCR